MKLIHKFIWASALALPSFVLASAPGQPIQVHVPFSFMVGAKQFTAGDYRILQTDSGVLYVQGEGRSAVAITIPADMKTGSATGLRFTSADQHYLTGVQVEGESARSLPLPEDRKVTLTPAR